MAFAYFAQKCYNRTNTNIITMAPETPSSEQLIREIGEQLDYSEGSDAPEYDLNDATAKFDKLQEQLGTETTPENASKIQTSLNVLREKVRLNKERLAGNADLQAAVDTLDLELKQTVEIVEEKMKPEEIPAEEADPDEGSTPETVLEKKSPLEKMIDKFASHFNKFGEKMTSFIKPSTAGAEKIPLPERIGQIIETLKKIAIRVIGPWVPLMLQWKMELPDWLYKKVPGMVELNAMLEKNSRTLETSEKDAEIMRSLIQIHNKTESAFKAKGKKYELADFFNDAVTQIDATKSKVTMADVRKSALVVAEAKEKEAATAAPAPAPTAPPVTPPTPVA
jgi:hypothetical protein